MKKQQIPFDFSKWGQDNVSVNYNGLEVCTLAKSYNSDDVYICEYNPMGKSSQLTFAHISSFTMFEEIKPREIWINEYPYEHPAFYTSEADAIEDTREHFIKRSKFIEVL